MPIFDPIRMTESKPGKLYLIPSALGEAEALHMLAPFVKQQVQHLKYFLVESGKSGRAAIRNLQLLAPQSALNLQLLNEHTLKHTKNELLLPALEGHDMGLISDAGLPCVADPGSDIVALAHMAGITVVPLPGPSSIMLALMASGFNGQGFVFHGYLPVDKVARPKKIRELEQDMNRKKQTQIFIEAPYRNNQVLQDLLKHCQATTWLCVAANLLQPDQFIRSTSISEWRKLTIDLHKQPVVFLMGTEFKPR